MFTEFEPKMPVVVYFKNDTVGFNFHRFSYFFISHPLLTSKFSAPVTSSGFCFLLLSFQHFQAQIYLKILNSRSVLRFI